MTKEELKPCPFCGWNATDLHFGTNQVHCLNPKCGAHIEHIDCDQLKGSAIKAWNKRV
jgi:hypothetical protein